MNQDKEFLILILRDAIASKEVIIAKMNLQTRRYGEWSNDHIKDIHRIDQSIEDIVSRIDKEG